MLIRMCEVAVNAQGSGLKLDYAEKTFWEQSQKQYEAFAPGVKCANGLKALKRKCEKIDPSYKN